MFGSGFVVRGSSFGVRRSGFVVRGSSFGVRRLGFVVPVGSVRDIQRDADNRCDDHYKRREQFEEENATSLAHNVEP
jgi:hypothetical protein